MAPPVKEHITEGYTHVSNRVTLKVHFNEFTCYRIVCKTQEINRVQRAIFNDECEITDSLYNKKITKKH